MNPLLSTNSIQPTSREQRDSAKKEPQSHSGGGSFRRDRGQERSRERRRGHERVGREVPGSSSKRQQREGDDPGAGVDGNGGDGRVRKRQRMAVEKNDGGFDERKNAAAGSTRGAGTKLSTGSVVSDVTPESASNSIEGHRGEEQQKSKKKSKKKKKEEDGIVSGDVRWPLHETTIFVKGLGAGTTSADLKKAIEGKGLGTVTEARVVEDKKTHEMKV